MTVPIDYESASAEVRAVFDDIKASRNVPDVNNFWKYLARDPALLKRTWESIKEVMAPGAIDPLVKGDDLYRGERDQWLRVLHPFPHRERAQGRHDGSDVRRADGRGRHGQ